MEKAGDESTIWRKNTIRSSTRIGSLFAMVDMVDQPEGHFLFLQP
jgi:hypothetical protein